MKKRNALLIGLSTILAASSVGITLAIFAHKSSTDIDVKSAKVEVRATLDSLKTYSADSTLTEGDVVPGGDNLGDNSGTYYYKELADGKFSNGGSAELNDGKLKITSMTPGDKASVKLNVFNESNVAFKYRVIFETADNSINALRLFSTLNISAFDTDLTGASRYATNWALFDSSKASMSYDVDVSFPIDASYYPDSTCGIKFTLEAVQANAITHDEEPTYLNLNESTVEKEDDSTFKDLVVGDENVNIKLNLNNGTVKVLKANGQKVDIAEGETITLKVENSSLGNIVVEDGSEAVCFDISLVNADGDKIVSNAEDIAIKIFIGTYKSVSKVYHSGVEVSTTKYSYDGASGYITILSDSFSPFAVVSKTCTHTEAFNNKTASTCADCHATQNILKNDGVSAKLEQSDTGYYAVSYTGQPVTGFEWVDAVGDTLVFTNYTGSAQKTGGFKTLDLVAGKTYVAHSRVTNTGETTLKFELEVDTTSIDAEILKYVEISYSEILPPSSWTPKCEVLSASANEIVRISVEISDDLPASLSGAKISNLPVKVNAHTYED